MNDNKEQKIGQYDNKFVNNLKMTTKTFNLLQLIVEIFHTNPIALSLDEILEKLKEKNEDIILSKEALRKTLNYRSVPPLFVKNFNKKIYFSDWFLHEIGHRILDIDNINDIFWKKGLKLRKSGTLIHYICLVIYEKKNPLSIDEIFELVRDKGYLALVSSPEAKSPDRTVSAWISRFSFQQIFEKNSLNQYMLLNY